MMDKDLRLISIDPGTSNCGIAFWKLRGDNLNIKDLKTLTLTIDNNLNVESRIWMLYEYFNNIFRDFKPLQVAHEGSFMNRFRPMAYGPIYTSINVIRHSFLEYSGNINRIFEYPPKLVKSYIWKGTANKTDMLKGLMKIKELMPYINNNQTEHEIDAMAIGYSHLLNIRYFPELLLY